ncbi:MAG: hypothetical protein P4L65_03415 [Legionella sp.]|nr:hypothetical protein [Legionella sp.]
MPALTFALESRNKLKQLEIEQQSLLTQQATLAEKMRLEVERIKAEEKRLAAINQQQEKIRLASHAAYVRKEQLISTEQENKVTSLITFNKSLELMEESINKLSSPEQSDALKNLMHQAQLVVSGDITSTRVDELTKIMDIFNTILKGEAVDEETLDLLNAEMNKPSILDSKINRILIGIGEIIAGIAVLAALAAVIWLFSPVIYEVDVIMFLLFLTVPGVTAAGYLIYDGLASIFTKKPESIATQVREAGKLINATEVDSSNATAKSYSNGNSNLLFSEKSLAADPAARESPVNEESFQAEPTLGI